MRSAILGKAAFVKSFINLSARLFVPQRRRAQLHRCALNTFNILCLCALRQAGSQREIIYRERESFDPFALTIPCKPFDVAIDILISNSGKPATRPALAGIRSISSRAIIIIIEIKLRFTFEPGSCVRAILQAYHILIFML